MDRIGTRGTRGRREESAQAVTELAVIMPLCILLMGAIIHIGMLGYAVCFSNFAAFATLRAAAVRPALRAPEAARAYADGIVRRAPGISLRSLQIGSAGEDLLSLNLTLSVWRAIPFLPEDLALVRARYAMPMEPVW